MTAKNHFAKIPVNRIVGFIKAHPVKTVIFLGHFDEPDKYTGVLRDIIGKCAGAELCIVNLNLINPAGLDLAGIKIVTPADLFSAKDYEAMDTAAYGLTCGWYAGLESKEGLTEHKKIKVAEMAEATVQQIFSQAVRNAHVTARAISLFRPQNTVIIDELGDLKDLDRFIETEYSVPSLRVTNKSSGFSVRYTVARIKGGTAVIASLILDWIVRYLLLRADLSDKNGLIDKDLSLLFNDRWARSKFIPFSICSGLRMRVQLLTQSRSLYVPIIVRKSFKYFIPRRRFSNYWKRLEKSRKFRGSMRYEDINIWTLVEREIESVVTFTFPQISQNFIFLERFFKRHSLKLVVLRDATREPERTIVLAARTMNISTLVIQPGALSAKNVYTRIHSDKVAVWGASTTRWYEGFGNDASRCVVTGSPKHDLFFEKEPFSEHNKVYAELGLDPNKKTILHVADFIRFYPMLAPSFLVDIERVVIDGLLKAIEAIPDTQLVLKFHPFEYPDVWERSLRRYKNIKNVVIVKNYDFFTLIKISSVITTVFSTGGIDALLLDKPLVCFKYFDSEEPIPYGEGGVALVVRRSDELVGALKKMFEDKNVSQRLSANRAAFVHDYAYKYDGRSKERILTLMRSMC